MCKITESQLVRYAKLVNTAQQYGRQKVFLPEPTGTKTPVRCNIALDSDLPMPRSAFLDFPFEACLESSGGTRHRLAPLRQPIPREE